jgi:hypothetical protein
VQEGRSHRHRVLLGGTGLHRLKPVDVRPFDRTRYKWTSSRDDSVLRARELRLRRLPSTALAHDRTRWKAARQRQLERALGRWIKAEDPCCCVIWPEGPS